MREEIEDINAAQNKADRLWYDWNKFTTAEKKGRVAALIYAAVCGVATYVGLLAQTSVPFLATTELAICGMLITMGVNLYGFWDNVPNALNKNAKNSEKPSGKYAKAYTAFFILFAAAAIINSAAQLSPLLELIEGDETTSDKGIDKSYWYKFFLPILIFGGATAISMIGLFTQAPREWFANFTKNGFKLTIWEGMQALWYGQDVTKDTKLPSMSIGLVLGALTRGLLFIGFNVIFTYAIYAATQYAGENLVEILQDFFSHATKEKMPVDWIGYLIEPLGYIFVIGRGIYNMTISQKLAIGASSFLSACKDIGVKQHQSLQKNTASTIGNFWATGFATIFFIPWTLLVAEVYCWKEAVKYARIQHNIKNSYFFLPHIFARAIFNHMNIWGFINAYNNGAQNKHFYREGLEKHEGESFSETEQFKSILAEITGLSSSLGFYLFAAKPRAVKWENGEKYIEMEHGGEQPNKPTGKQEAVKTTWTTWWGWTRFGSADEAKEVHLGKPSLT